MAKCISCGKEAGEGQFFCPECLARMAPEKEAPTRDVPAQTPAAAAPAVPEAPAQPEAPAEGPEEEESARPRIDPERSKVLTPAAEKKKLTDAGEPARPRIDPERSKVLTPAAEKKSVKPEAAPVGAPVKPRPGFRAARAAQPKREQREHLPPGERVKRGLKRQAAGLVSSLKSKRARSSAWVKELAYRKRCAFDRAGWFSWSAGMVSTVLFLVSVLFFPYKYYEWILTGSNEIFSNKVSIMGIDMGGWGILLTIDAVLLLLLYAWNLSALKWEPRLKVNPDFLAACLSLFGLILVMAAIGSSEALKHAIAGKTGLAYDLIESESMGYSEDKMAFGAFVSAMSLLFIFMASAARISEKGASSKLGKKLAARFASKKRGRRA